MASNKVATVILIMALAMIVLSCESTIDEAKRVLNKPPSPQAGTPRHMEETKRAVNAPPSPQSGPIGHQP
nr:hypothetical protein Iba_chr12eCG4920 [Ipomoea batatas]